MTEVLVSSTVLILALAALRWLLRGRIDPRLQYALWLLAALRLLLPVPLVSSPVSVMNAAADVPAAVQRLTAPEDRRAPQPAAEAAAAQPAAVAEPQAQTKEKLPVRTILKTVWLAGAAVLALGIGVQNLPEGLAVALPFRAGGMSRGRSFALGALSGAVEPVFGMLAALAAGMMQGALPGMMAFCAGAMMQVVFAEMAPQAAKSRVGLFALMTGYALMMALDLALG